MNLKDIAPLLRPPMFDSQYMFGMLYYGLA